LHLKECGYDVNTLDLEWFGNVVNPDNIVQDYRETFNKEYDTVIMLAGHSSVPMCKDDMISSFKNNLVNFVNLLDTLTTQKFIYASSSSIYGNTGEIAATEDWEQYDPKTYYDLQKQEIDYYSRLSDVEYYGLRFGTVNGWSPNLRTDIMINKMYQCASEDGKITIFNKGIHRPILGIEDLCRAMEAIVKGGDHRGIYNLASFNATVEQIANSIRDALDHVEIEDKGETPTYNFSIDTTKFQTTYSFKFKETVDSIVKSLVARWNTTHKGIRERRTYV